MYFAIKAPSAGSMSGGMAMGGASGTTADFVGLPLLFLIVLLASGVWELDGAERFTLSRSVPTERVRSVAWRVLPVGDGLRGDDRGAQGRP